jgi:hypothetical protein
MNVNAREVVPGAVWAVSIPIIPGVTGRLVETEPCKCLDGRHGGLRWFWSVTVRPPGWKPNIEVFGGSNLISLIEFSRHHAPADPVR